MKKKKRKRRYHTGVHLSEKCTSGQAHYRSGWELSFLIYLDSDPNVISYAYEGIKIPYVGGVRLKKLRNYIPDLIVLMKDGKEVVIEIKPACYVGRKKNQQKFDAARAWCIESGREFMVLTEVELKDMGII